MRPALCFALACAVQLVSSCKQRCEGEFDCGRGSYCDRTHHRCEIDCFTDEDCRAPVECRAKPENCVPKGLYCSQRGQCVGKIAELPPPETPVDVVERPPDGWGQPAGEGVLFVMNTIQMGGEGVGFDLDGDDGIDNVLWPIAKTLNPSIEMGLLSGEILILIEIAGLDEPYTGQDDSVTIKIYGGIDADYPADSLNNFALPAGREGRCCEFKIDSRWLTIENMTLQATVRAPASIENYRLVAPTNFPHHTFDVQFLLTIGTPPYYFINIANSRLELELDSDLSRLRRGILGGGLTANSLAAIRNPFCGSRGETCPSGDPSSTLFDLTAFLDDPSPDIDVDGDGAECALDLTGDSLFDVCCDGAGLATCDPSADVCPGEVLASSTSDPRDCARSAGFTDGYSTSFLFTAVRAVPVEIGTDR